MTIKIQCPHCEQRISASDDVVGKDVECPTCQRVFKAAAISAAEPVAAPVETAGNEPSPPPEQKPVTPIRSALPVAPPPPARPGGGGTAIMVASAVAVVVGGLVWWNTLGPGFPEMKATPADGKKTP